MNSTVHDVNNSVFESSPCANQLQKSGELFTTRPPTKPPAAPCPMQAAALTSPFSLPAAAQVGPLAQAPQPCAGASARPPAAPAAPHTGSMSGPPTCRVACRFSPHGAQHLPDPAAAPAAPHTGRCEGPRALYRFDPPQAKRLPGLRPAPTAPRRLHEQFLLVLTLGPQSCAGAAPLTEAPPAAPSRAVVMHSAGARSAALCAGHACSHSPNALAGCMPSQGLPNK